MSKYKRLAICECNIQGKEVYPRGYQCQKCKKIRRCIQNITNKQVKQYQQYVLGLIEKENAKILELAEWYYQYEIKNSEK